MEPPIHSDPELFDALPESFKELAECIPVADLLKLSEAYGGTRISISEAKLSGLAERLGDDLARRLVYFTKGEEITVPLCQGLCRLLKRREAWAMKEQGKSTGEIALALKTTDATIARMLKRERENRQRQGIPLNTSQSHLENRQQTP